MSKSMSGSILVTGLLFMLLSVPASGSSVNSSIKIGAGETADGARSVNGSISVGRNAVVNGDVETVNGAIRIDDGAQIENVSTVNGGLRIADNVKSTDLSTVNGSVKVGSSVSIDGTIEAVNGRITVMQGSSVSQDVSNVNGQIELSGAQIGGDVSTVSGDIRIVDSSVVRGDLIVEKPGGWNWGKKRSRKPRVVIGPGSSIGGTIHLEREVELFISESAKIGTIKGVMSLDDAVRFSGDHP